MCQSQDWPKALGPADLSAGRGLIPSSTEPPEDSLFNRPLRERSPDTPHFQSG
jgi:hypothetical protein